MHSALQGAMVCHLSGSMQIGALRDDCAKAWLKWHNERDAAVATPETLVASPFRLLKRLTGSARQYDVDCGGILEVGESQIKSFDSLHDLRNRFTHFLPQFWSIEIELIRESVNGVLDILELIVADSWAFMRMDDGERRALDSRIAEIRKSLSEPLQPREEGESDNNGSIPPEIAAALRNLKT